MYFKLSELVQFTFSKTPLDNVIGGVGGLNLTPTW
jgi:hypothetical protein